MARRILALCGVTLVLFPAFGSATTVIPVGFDDLVARAELIFVGQVIDRRSMYDTGRDTPIITNVTFDVLHVLKGDAGLRTQLTFLGGRVGAEALVVSGMPQFEIGDRDMLFVAANRKGISPLVGFWQGRFRIVRDPATGLDHIRTHSGGAVFDALQPASRPAVQAAAGAAGRDGSLSVSAFAALVQARLAARAGR